MGDSITKCGLNVKYSEIPLYGDIRTRGSVEATHGNRGKPYTGNFFKDFAKKKLLKSFYIDKVVTKNLDLKSMAEQQYGLETEMNETLL